MDCQFVLCILVLFSSCYRKTDSCNSRPTQEHRNTYVQKHNPEHRKAIYPTVAKKSQSTSTDFHEIRLGRLRSDINVDLDLPDKLTTIRTDLREYTTTLQDELEHRPEHGEETVPTAVRESHPSLPDESTTIRTYLSSVHLYPLESGRYELYGEQSTNKTNLRGYTTTLQDELENHPGYGEEIVPKVARESQPSRSVIQKINEQPITDLASVLALENKNCSPKCVSGYRNFCWDATPRNTTQQRPCPQEYNGTAIWFCGVNGKWTSLYPDLSNCTASRTREAVRVAINSMRNGDRPHKVIANLTESFKGTRILSGDIKMFGKVFDNAIDYQKATLKEINNLQERSRIAKEFTVSAVSLTNTILNNTQSFWGFQQSERRVVVNEIQNQLDAIVDQLSDNLLNDNEPFVIENDTVVIKAIKGGKDTYGNTSYTFTSNKYGNITLPSGFQHVSSKSTETRLSFVILPTMASALYGDLLEEWEYNYTKLGSEAAEKIQFINTPVVGVSIDGRESPVYFTSGYVTINLPHINTLNYNISSRSCVFWNKNTTSWSSDGCKVIHSDSRSTACQCNHATNFAVLMDVTGYLNKDVTKTLQGLTIVGVIISVICLLFAVVIFYWVRTLRSDLRFKIHRNLCLSLLIADVLLLTGLDATYDAHLCKTIGVFLHFFYLAAFGWMFAEGLHLYFMVVKVFEISWMKNYYYYICGYGMPALIVIITLVSTLANAYGTERYCWLRNDNYEILAFTIPVGIIVLVNTLFLIVALRVVARRNNRREDPNSKQWIIGLLSLTFLLGITWIFGYLFLIKELVGMAYVFTIFNSLQGASIFLTQCILNKKVAKDTKRQLLQIKTIERLVTFLRSPSSRDGVPERTSSSKTMETSLSLLRQQNSALSPS